MPFYRNRKTSIKRVLKITGWTILSIFVLINITILVSGKFHIYRAIQNTIFQGRLKPSIHEYSIFYNRTIEATNPKEWATHPSYAKNDLKTEDVELFNTIGTESFLIIKNDSLFYEKYWPEYNNSNKDSISNSFSVAKSIISLLIGIAVDEGKIESIDDPIGKYVKSYNEEGKEKITLRHLLTMSSGLNWDESATPFSDNTEAYYGWDLEDLMDKQSVMEDPGVYFDYMSGNTQLLGFALEKATETSVSAYAQEKLWGPIGATSDALWNLDTKDGHEKTFCCVYATSRDYARIGQLMLNNGVWNGKRIISSSYLKQAVTYADLKVKPDDSRNKKYGLSWWLDTYKGLQIFYARGILGQYIICIPEHKLVVVRTGYSRGEKLETDHAEDLYWYIDAALEMTSKK